MIKKESKLKTARKESEAASNESAKKIELLGHNAKELFNSITELQNYIGEITNINDDERIKYETIKNSVASWRQQVELIDSEYKRVAAANDNKKKKDAQVAAFVSLSLSMGLATALGAASEKLKKTTLICAAPSRMLPMFCGRLMFNALPGLGATGGGGMMLGTAFFYPLGIAAIIGEGIYLIINNNKQKKLDQIFTLIFKRDKKYHELAVVEINERSSKILSENSEIINAISSIKTFGTDYRKMSEKQQYMLGAYVNLLESSAQLLINPILAFMPKYSERDYDKFFQSFYKLSGKTPTDKNKELIVYFADLLYEIEINEKECHLIYNLLKKDKNFLKSFELLKNEFNPAIIEAVCTNNKKS